MYIFRVFVNHNILLAIYSCHCYMRKKIYHRNQILLHDMKDDNIGYLIESVHI